MKLVPCPGCHRHVRCEESACPFCGVTLACSSAKAGSAAAAFLAATLALTGCPDKAPEPVAKYGGPPMDDRAKPVAPVASEAPTQPPQKPPMVQKYGAPPTPDERPR
jgi:hypothetical protein